LKERGIKVEDSSRGEVKIILKKRKLVEKNA